MRLHDYLQRLPSVASAFRKNARAMPVTTTLYGFSMLVCICVWMNLHADTRFENDHVLTLSAGLQALGFALLIWNARSRTAEGLSERSCGLFCIACATRLFSLCRGKGYMPEDNTGGLYLALQFVGLLLLTYKFRKVAWTRRAHGVGQAEKWDITAIILVGCLILSLLTKSNAHSNYFLDLLWIFAFWVDTFAIVPQILYLRKSMYVDDTQVHFVVVTMLGGMAFGGFLFSTEIDHFLQFLRSESGAPSGALLRYSISVIVASVIRILLGIVYCAVFLNTTYADLLPEKNCAPQQDHRGVWARIMDLIKDHCAGDLPSTECQPNTQTCRWV